jgi:hypothetical protein
VSAPVQPQVRPAVASTTLARAPSNQAPDTRPPPGPPRRRRGRQAAAAVGFIGVVALAGVGGLIGWGLVQALDDTPAGTATTGPGSPLSTTPTGATLVAAQLNQVAGRWLTIVVTLPGQWTEDRVAQSVAEMAGRGLDVDALHTDDVASFTPGSWVLFESDWATPDEAVGRCATLGLTGANQCIARLASGDAGDRGQVRTP